VITRGLSTGALITRGLFRPISEIIHSFIWAVSKVVRRDVEVSAVVNRRIRR